jgi:hypothetical protein
MIKAQMMEITPEKASIWLIKAAKNRPLSPQNIANWAIAMREGAWRENGEGIIFDWEGKLIDGQNRLTAIVRAGVSVRMLVVTGVDDPCAFETIDSGKKRTAADACNVAGMRNSNTVCAVARRLLAWERTYNKQTFSINSDMFNHMANPDIVAYALAHQEEILGIRDSLARSTIYKRSGAGTALITALILCNRKDDVTTTFFIEDLKTGVDLKANSPAHLLRERLLDRPARLTRNTWENEVMALTIKAWNKFAQDKPLKTLRWRVEGANPEKFPIPGEDK